MSRTLLFLVVAVVVATIIASVQARRMEPFDNHPNHFHKHQYPEKYVYPPMNPPLDKSKSLHTNGEQFKGFLMNNMLPSMPRSYLIYPENYFEKVPADQRPHHYNTSHYVVPCHNESIGPEAMNKYMFQTEHLLTALGLDIYDGAMWCIALSLLGETETCLNFTQTTMVKHKTVQFPDIRGDHPCKGIMEEGQCSDPEQSGVCGFCYGDAAGDAAKSLTVDNAFFFRLISDYWAIEGTVDDRCPKLHNEWIWNDYKPVLGENAWAQLLGPASTAMIRNKFDATKITAQDPVFVMGIPFLQALAKMRVTGTFKGAFFRYTPFNTWFGFNKVAQNIGNTFSTENQASLLAGLQALHYIIKQQGASSQFASYLTQIEGYITDIKTLLIETVFDKEVGFFRQGGTILKDNSIKWGQNNEPGFAVDCQTWVSSVLGTKLIDSKLGPRTAFKVWQLTKQYANWTCPSGGLCGIGYTFNNISGQVFSGEWTEGAVNWLRVMIADSGYDSADISSLNSDVNNMLFGLESFLYDSTPVVNGSTVSYPSLRYAERRYWIPFGWYANRIPATASTAWAVAVANKFNPFCVDKGDYACSYLETQ